MGQCEACWSGYPSSLAVLDSGKLSQGDGPTDGSGYLLGALDTQTDISNISMVISDGNKCPEPGPVASLGLLLHRRNL